MRAALPFCVAELSKPKTSPSDWVAAVVAMAPAGLAFAMFLGLGMHRRAPAFAVVISGFILLVAPPAAQALSASSRRSLRFSIGLGIWSLSLLLILPIYFPGERREAIASGLSVLRLGSSWDDISRRVADHLPDEPVFSEPEPPLATAVVDPVSSAAIHLDDDQIALPFDGEGRRLSVPVVFEHNGKVVETWMMLDTGATYTTLPEEVLVDLGAVPGPGAPVLTLHTANGNRQASMALVDRVWLGDLPLSGIAIARCDECPSGDTSGLLGLNVTGGYNLTIDSDRREVVFTEREARDSKLDVGPFIDVSARFSRFPGGRVEVEVAIVSRAPQTVSLAKARITCSNRDQSWLAEVYEIPPGGERSSVHRLPEHDTCDGYRVSLDHGEW